MKKMSIIVSSTPRNPEDAELKLNLNGMTTAWYAIMTRLSMSHAVLKVPSGEKDFLSQ
jgi:hypothetical protein